MQNHKIKSYIGFAVRANDVVYGLDNILSMKKVDVIVVDSTLGKASMRKLQNFLDKNKVEIVTLDDISLSDDILKRDNVKIIGVLNKELAKAIIAAAKEE